MSCAAIAVCALLSWWLGNHGYDAPHREAVLAYVRSESDFQWWKIEWSGACLFQWAGERRRDVLAAGHGRCPSWRDQAIFADRELRTLFRGFWTTRYPGEHMRRHFGAGAPG